MDKSLNKKYDLGAGTALRPQGLGLVCSCRRDKIQVGSGERHYWSCDLMLYNLGQVKFSELKFSYLKIGIITAYCSKA